MHTPPNPVCRLNGREAEHTPKVTRCECRTS
jgi:hypothetical protein